MSLNMSEALPIAPRVGDHPAMDFLNTHATPGGVATEWLTTGADLLNWLEQADLIDSKTAARFRADKTAKTQLEVVAKGARALREWLRGFVRRHAGQALPLAVEAELGPLNLLLAGDKGFARVSGGAEGLALQRLRRW